MIENARQAHTMASLARSLRFSQPVTPPITRPSRKSFFGFYGALYPVYFRGEAYLAAHKGAEAAAEFEKILRHRSIFVSDPMGALARLQLARAYALAGSKTKARSGYQDFLALWKDADLDIPILRQAKADYQKLQ